MKKKTLQFLIFSSLFLTQLTMMPSAVFAQPGGEVITGGAGDQGRSAACDFRSAMRKLWEDHITWTRLFIISALDGLPNLEVTTQRLLKNQVDIGDAIKPFYGTAAGNELTRLLRSHILIAAEIVTALKAGDQNRAAEASRRWLVNADEIAAFLAAANPKNWPLDEMKEMMRDHLRLTTAEVLAHLEHRWADDVRAYDQIHLQILEMADMLAFGLIDQFPEKF
jgi:hypothetical protein